ncbi:2'-5' RNA ligase family protein [Deinococcus radiomollis]|uniref:2'-5' RNA ligase family protein n=1 Tax=Deinococcus radiomollis TaxID=468916 RepID=UPI00389288C6
MNAGAGGGAADLFFVGVVPPASLGDRVAAWQQALSHVVTPPHVTLKAPGHLSAAQLDACAEVCRATPAFRVQLGGVQTFGDRVIYLEAAGAGLHALHARLVVAVGESATPFELAGYHPHLTLAVGWRSFRLSGLEGSEPGKVDPERWAELLEHARASFADLSSRPVLFDVTEAVLFRKDAPGQPYRELTRWALEG